MLKPIVISQDNDLGITSALSLVHQTVWLSICTALQVGGVSLKNMNKAIVLLSHSLSSVFWLYHYGLHYQPFAFHLVN